jgi:high frequency lysogenization protein
MKQSVSAEALLTMLFGKKKNYYDITLALAGIFQAILLVKNMAKTGKADEQAFLTTINTIYKISPQNANTVYDGPESLYLGLKEVINFFDVGKKGQDPDVTRYLLGLIYLEKKLSRNKKMQNNLRERITRAINQARFFPPTHPSILANLGDAYSQTLGKLHYRISIVGRTNYLKRHDLMDKIRALLLAGVRSVVLWKQVGGSRWELLWGRKQILEIATNLCKKCEQKKL